MKSIKTESIGNIDNLEPSVLLYLEEKIDFLINEGLEDEHSDILKCESPIEKLMFLSLKDFFRNANFFNERFEYAVNPQEKIIHRHQNYRADIVIQVADFKEEKHFFFAIECDGHEFHEKTKEQVRKDRLRERRFMELGYTVIRFAGSEIVEDPEGCVIDVWKIAKARMGL